MTGWLCPSDRHEMVAPNLYWTWRKLDRPPRTAKERQTGRRWIPHCRVCEESRSELLGLRDAHDEDPTGGRSREERS